MRIALKGLFAMLLLGLPVGLLGCDALGDLFGEDTEATGNVSEVGTDFLVVESTRYDVTSETEFEGFTGLADISVGAAVGIEYEERDGARLAIEIEDASAGGDD